eukprot:178554_1
MRHGFIINKYCKQITNAHPIIKTSNDEERQTRMNEQIKEYELSVAEDEDQDDNRGRANGYTILCSYFECDQSKIHRISSLTDEYPMIRVINDNDIWSLNDKRNQYYKNKMININYCQNRQLFEWSALREDLCLLFHCESFSNHAKHLQLSRSAITADDHHEDITRSLVIDLSDIECHSKLFLMHWIPFFACVLDIDNMIADINVYLSKVDTKDKVYVIGDEDSDIYKAMNAHYQLPFVALDKYNEDAFDVIMIASEAQCFIGSFYNELSNAIALNRGWKDNVCSTWYKTHGAIANIKFVILMLCCASLVGYALYFVAFKGFIRFQLPKRSKYVMICIVLVVIAIIGLIIHNIFELSVNVLMEFKFM